MYNITTQSYTWRTNQFQDGMVEWCKRTQVQVIVAVETAFNLALLLNGAGEDNARISALCTHASSSHGILRV